MNAEPDIDLERATDGALLAAFGRTGSEAAFAALVSRHQTMVYNACVRGLRQSADAEDASQAVFLALSHKAADAGLHARATLAGWLYEAAWHVSARMRDAADLRKKREREAASMHEQLAASAAQWSSVSPLLDGELKELPEKYRLPIVLHYLEQRSVEETAGLMRCSTDATKQRLCRGRDMLRNRLARRGTVLPAVAIAALLAKEAAAQTMGSAIGATFANGAAKLAASQLSGQALAMSKFAAEATTRALLIRRIRRPLWLLGAVAGLALAVMLGWQAMSASSAPLNIKSSTVSKAETPPPAEIQRARPDIKQAPAEETQAVAEKDMVAKDEVAQKDAIANEPNRQLGQTVFDRGQAGFDRGQAGFDPAVVSQATNAVQVDRLKELKDEKEQKDEEMPFPEEKKPEDKKPDEKKPASKM